MTINKNKINNYIFKTLIILALLLSINVVVVAKNFNDTHSYRSPFQSPFVKKQSAPAPVIKEAKAEEVQIVIPQTESEWTQMLLQQKAKASGLTDADVTLLTRIAKCESALHNVPNKDGKSSAIGAFQILAMHDNKGNRFVTEGNIDIAIKLYKTQGTTPWVSSRYCWEE